MNPEYLEELKKAVEAVVPPAIEKHVNGHIRKVHAKLDEHIAQHEKDSLELKQSLEPVIEGMRTLQSLKRFVTWWGLPPAVLIGGALFMFNMFL